jgi:hypothetical protein
MNIASIILRTAPGQRFRAIPNSSRACISSQSKTVAWDAGDTTSDLFGMVAIIAGTVLAKKVAALVQVRAEWLERRRKETLIART